MRFARGSATPTNDLNAFLRGTTRRAVTIRLNRKADPSPAERRAAFAARLAEADEANAAMILRAVGQALALDAGDLLPGDAEAAEALADWDEGVGPLADPSDRARIEEELVHRFASRINALRQQALGIERYVWRSRDDARVRPGHAAQDDRLFDWEEPPEGGHPGEDWGCRCWAEPVLPEAEGYAPRTGADFAQYWLRAEALGMAQAVGDTLKDTWLGIEGAALLAGDIRRWGALRLSVALGFASGEDREALRELEADFAARIESAEAGLRTALDPATWAAFRDYLLAVRARPALVGEAYAEGIATEGQLWEAHRERAYVETLLILNVGVGGIPRRALASLGRSIVPEDPGALRRALADEAARLRRAPDDHGFMRIPATGIPWGRGIREQGLAWEAVLELDLGLPGRLHANFPTFDFYDPVNGLATSAKTLDTLALTYTRDPRTIYTLLKRHIEASARFDQGQLGADFIDSSMIEVRRIELAVPSGTSAEQRMHIQRAIEYAAERGVELHVTVTE